MKPQQSADREIQFRRVLNATRERVWQAITDPKQLDAWWGPDGFRNVTQEIDIRPGGIWKHTMIGPDGAEYPNLTRFEEVVKLDRIVYTNGGGRKGGPGASFRATWSLKPLGAKTEVTVTLVFDTPEDRDFVVKEFGALEGGKQTLGRLAAQVETVAFVLTLSRVINAPRQRVFEAWTKPEQITRWLAPKPFTLSVEKMDFREGGSFAMTMHGPKGETHPFTGIYREVVPSAKLVWTGEFSDGPPEQIRTEVNLEEQGNKTKVTVRQSFTVLTPVTELYAKGAQQGWTMTLDQLAAYAEA